jgi:hypothetical protein
MGSKFVTNTWFKKPKRRRYTWKAPGDWSRHQLDYILVKQRFRNSVKDVQTLPGADIDSITLRVMDYWNSVRNSCENGLHLYNIHVENT